MRQEPHPSCVKLPLEEIIPVLHWLRDRRRAEARKRPFPHEWETFLRANVTHYCMLDDAERAELRAMIQVFLEEKHWEGCGGLDLTDEIRVTIAAQACLLQLKLPHDYSVVA